jgi:hypothetical protein
MGDYMRDVAREYVHELTPEEHPAAPPARDVVERFSPEERLGSLTPPELMERERRDRTELAKLFRWTR